MATQIPIANPLETQTAKCLVCNNDSKAFRKGIRGDVDALVYACNHCLLQFILPPEENLRDYYRNGYRAEHDAIPGKVLTPEERFLTYRPLMREQAGRFRDAVPEGSSLLEIGCSAGYFLDAIGDKYDRYGVEWNPEDAAYVRDVGELPCEEGSLTEVYPGQTFNAIAALQVLEHQANPVEFLHQCKERLIGGGYLYLELPSAMDALATTYNVPQYRDFWYRKAHITYWTRETLASVLGSLGFEAHVKVCQRYGLLNHLNWMLHDEPMENVQLAQEFLKPLSEEHPMAPVLNRLFSRLDKEYRVNMASYGCSDTIYAVARVREL